MHLSHWHIQDLVVFFKNHTSQLLTEPRAEKAHHQSGLGGFQVDEPRKFHLGLGISHFLPVVVWFDFVFNIDNKKYFHSFLSSYLCQTVVAL
jgi:hypothetical protein